MYNDNIFVFFYNTLYNFYDFLSKNMKSTENISGDFN